MNRKPMGLFQILGVIALIFLALLALANNYYFSIETKEVVREMSYYIEEKTFGVIGRYHYDEELIAVVTELPIENE